jgi:hypothetical protein
VDIDFQITFIFSRSFNELSQKGFTLIELMIVVAIGWYLAAVACLLTTGLAMSALGC